MINYIPRKFTVIRDKELCINCGCCVRQCSNECHYFDEDGKTVLVNSKIALHVTGVLTFVLQVRFA